MGEPGSVLRVGFSKWSWGGKRGTCMQAATELGAGAERSEWRKKGRIVKITTCVPAQYGHCGSLVESLWILAADMKE